LLNLQEHDCVLTREGTEKGDGRTNPARWGRESHWQDPAQACGAAVRRRQQNGAAAGRQGLWRAAIYNPMHIYRLSYNLTVSRSAACLNNCSQHGACSADGLCHCEGDWRAPPWQDMPPRLCSSGAAAQARLLCKRASRRRLTHGSGEDPARNAQLLMRRGERRGARRTGGDCSVSLASHCVQGSRRAVPMCGPSGPAACCATEPQHAALVSRTLSI